MLIFSVSSGVFFFFFLVSNACAFAYIFSTVISSDDTEPSSKAKTEINI